MFQELRPTKYTAKNGGYASVEKALEWCSDEVVEEVKNQDFVVVVVLVLLEWNGVLLIKNQENHVICNADESEPGTFKDRYLMEFILTY
jgi:NADH-quinone oxidoreductase subunit F